MTERGNGSMGKMRMGKWANDICPIPSRHFPICLILPFRHCLIAPLPHCLILRSLSLQSGTVGINEATWSIAGMAKSNSGPDSHPVNATRMG